MAKTALRQRPNGLDAPAKTLRLVAAPSRRKGVTTVEFALTVPIAFMLLFATIEFARVNMIRNTLVNAAYTGARRAMVPGSTAKLAIDEAKKVLSICGIKDGVITVTPSTLTPTTNEVSVTVTVPLNKNVWISPMFMKKSDYARTCTLSRERAKH